MPASLVVPPVPGLGVAIDEQAAAATLIAIANPAHSAKRWPDREAGVGTLDMGEPGATDGRFVDDLRKTHSKQGGLAESHLPNSLQIAAGTADAPGRPRRADVGNPTKGRAGRGKRRSSSAPRRKFHRLVGRTG